MTLFWYQVPLGFKLIYVILPLIVGLYTLPVYSEYSCASFLKFILDPRSIDQLLDTRRVIEVMHVK